MVVINPDRFLPSRQLIRQQLDTGKLGDVGLIRIHRWEHNDSDVGWDQLASNAGPPICSQDDVSQQNGGPALRWSHPTGLLRDLDLVLWLIGKLPDAVHAVEQSGSTSRTIQLHLGFPGGAMALIDYTNQLPNGDGYQSLSAIGSSGAAYADDHQNMQLVFRGGQAQAVRAEETGRRHSAAVQERIDSLQAGHDVAACVAEWQNVLIVAESVRQAISSCSSGEPVGVSPRMNREPNIVRGLTPSGSPSVPFRCAALSAVKHDYVARGVTTHPRFKLVVVADDPQVPDWAHERNQQLADAFQIPYVRDVERALREFNIDVAIVSPEAERHCDLSIRAAALGTHVIADKPLSTTRVEADRLVDAIEKSGVKFLMWNRNFIPAVLDARNQIAAGAIGQPQAVHLDFYFAKDAGPPKGSRQPGYPPIDWQSFLIAAHVDGSDGGLGVEPMGELAIEGIYPLGYLRLLTGREVRRVFARSASHFHQVHADNDVEDLASVTLELEGGLIATLAIGRIGAASHPSGGDIKLRVVGSEGALVVNESRPEVGLYYRQQPPKEFRQRRVANDNDFLLAQNFANAIDTNSDTILDARASRAIFATVAAALESCRTGQAVDVK
ncbi:MAG: hypothetical protein FD138_3189 [Planctomycetota bacterium]|nr:MAG: hypothetical protein FD138_3189 [Planctomycetota bacterium]